MKVIVFGGAGFLGSCVSDELTKEGHEVTIFDLKKSQHINDKQKMIIGDIINQDEVNDAIKGKDVVYNFAGIADIGYARKNAYKTLFTNYVGNLNILNACIENKVERYLFASTLYVYSTLGSFYRASKQSCELVIESYAEKYELKYTTLRYGSLYGPRSDESNWIHKTILEALKGKKITREGDGEEIREYIHVFDAARLSVKSMSKEFENQCVIISGNQSIKIKDLMVMLREMFNNSIDLEFIESVEDVHYEITPYNFRPNLAKKIKDNTQIDLGQGIIDLIYHLADKSEKGQQVIKTKL